MVAVRVTLASLVRGWLTTPAVVTTAELFETQLMVLPSVPERRQGQVLGHAGGRVARGIIDREGCLVGGNLLGRSQWDASG
jgi:hypothetical protein